MAVDFRLLWGNGTLWSLGFCVLMADETISTPFGKMNIRYLIGAQWTCCYNGRNFVLLIRGISCVTRCIVLPTRKWWTNLLILQNCSGQVAALNKLTTKQDEAALNFLLVMTWKEVRLHTSYIFP